MVIKQSAVTTGKLPPNSKIPCDRHAERRAVHLLMNWRFLDHRSALYASASWYITFRCPPVQQLLGLASPSVKPVRPTALVVLYPLSLAVHRTRNASPIPRTRCAVWHPRAHAAAHSDLQQTCEILRDASFAKSAISPGQGVKLLQPRLQRHRPSLRHPADPLTSLMAEPQSALRYPDESRKPDRKFATASEPWKILSW